MNSLQIIFAAMLFVSISPVVFVALGENTREKSEMGYDWEAILDQVEKYTAERNEYKTSKDGWLKIYKRQQQERKQETGKSCHFPSFAEIKESILRSPHAKLFTEVNKSGNVEVYDFKSHKTYQGGCYDLNEYGGKIRSVDTEGKCVRLFSGIYCAGWSQSVYPGSTIIPDGRLKGVKSIGPCASNEFEHSVIIESSPPRLAKLPAALESFVSVPDLIGDADTRSGWSTVETNSNPVARYLLGPGNRVEALDAWIFPRHLKSPQVAENARVAGFEQSFYSKLELGKSDEPGFAIPLELGGPADQNYNFFPQNRKQAGYLKGSLVPLAKQYLSENPDAEVYWSVNFIYKNSSTTRPSGMWYRGGHVFQFVAQKIFYGYLPNLE